MSQSHWIVVLLCAASVAHGEVTIVIDRNTEKAATGEFRLARVPAPARQDSAAAAKVELVGGAIDQNGAGLSALTDGVVPTHEDQPESNLFFKAATWGGRVRMDLGRVSTITQLNSYSWHPSTRGPQLYKVYGSDGTGSEFNPMPATNLDPASCGWKLIAFVDTRRKEGQAGDGGQYGVSITNPDGSLGKYRYLLFDFFETEADDNWGNTFYSEIDVIASQ